MSDYSNTHWMKDLPDENFHCLPDKPYKDSRDQPKTWLPDLITKMAKKSCDSRLYDERGETDNSSPNSFAKTQTYQPAVTEVDEPFLLDCKESLEAGLEFTQGALAEHDASLGRTTFKNKSWAETMEKSITQMRSCIQRVNGFLAKF